MESTIKWQIGTPIKKGEYLVSCGGRKEVLIFYWHEDRFWVYDEQIMPNRIVKAWCKLSDIKPYKEEDK